MLLLTSMIPSCVRLVWQNGSDHMFYIVDEYGKIIAELSPRATYEILQMIRQVCPEAIHSGEEIMIPKSSNLIQ